MAVRSKKGRNFSAEEDVCVTRAWAKATLDSAVGNNQKSSMFWDKVFAFFKEMYTAATSNAVPEERTLASITNRWKRHISVECRIMDSIKKHNPRGTGQNEQTYAATLAQIFHAEQKKPFRFAACFEHLKDVPSFSMGTGQAVIAELPQELQELLDAAAAAGANNPPAVVNPHVETGTAVDTVNLRLERPMGVKQAKKRIQKMKWMDTENKRRRQDMKDASSQMKSLGIALEKTSKREILLKLAEKYEQRGDEEKASKYYKKLEDLLEDESESESDDEEAAVSSDGSDVGNGPLNGQVLLDLVNDNSGENDSITTN